MVSVPADTAVTTPPLLTVAVPLVALHTPPPVGSVYMVNVPTQSDDGPVIGPTVALVPTVTFAVAVVVPQLPVTE